MKPKLLKISVAPESSFSSRFERVPFFYSEWHFHPEIELVYIENGSGTQFIGNSIDNFNDGDMILVGSNLPHLWKCDDAYFAKDSVLQAASLVVHFIPNVLGDYFMEMPENKQLADLLLKAKQGIRIVHETKSQVHDYMTQLLTAKGSERIILLLQILQLLSLSKDLELITANNMEHPASAKESQRMTTIFQYLIQNFSKPISLNDIAAQANMSPNAFCRLFKTRTKKTFSRFLLEMRISHACKLLADTDNMISDIYYDCGFTNSSHFNRYFKQITGESPMNYRKKQLLMLNS